MEEWQVERQAELEQAPDAAPGYSPVPLPGGEVDAATFLSVLHAPGSILSCITAAQLLVAHCDVPLTSATDGLSYRRITLADSLSLIAGLNGQGVDAEALIAQIDAWPYQNVRAGLVDRAGKGPGGGRMGDERRLAAGSRRRRRPLSPPSRLILALAQLMSPAARLWMSGWLEAVRYAGMAGGGVPVPA